MGFQKKKLMNSNAERHLSVSIKLQWYMGIAKCCAKQNFCEKVIENLDMVAYACNPSPWEAEAGRSLHIR